MPQYTKMKRIDFDKWIRFWSGVGLGVLVGVLLINSYQSSTLDVVIILSTVAFVVFGLPSLWNKFADWRDNDS